MSSLSHYQSTFRISKHDATTNGIKGTQPGSTKRNRKPVSCTTCRTRKLKCDRQAPCTQCSKRGDSDACIYSSTSSGNILPDDGPRPSEAQIRLQKLEQMVTSLMQTTVTVPNSFNGELFAESADIGQQLNDLSAESPPYIPGADPGGHPNINGIEKRYLGATHWTKILENIRGVQSVLEPNSDGSEEFSLSNLSDETELIVNTSQSLTLTELCSSLPSRTVVNKLLSRYFSSRHHSPFIHSVKFTREYDSFWADPSSVSILWISMLFSLLWMGYRVDPSDVQEHFESTFYLRAGQALVTGRYQNGGPYCVEALLLYAQCKYFRTEDLDADAWMVTGVAARLAMRKGYHRDPKHLSNVSVFEGEMRRRTFFVLQSFDLLLSFQVGLPTTIHNEECDTELPGNLFDEDFDEGSTILPPSRPPTDPTPMLYFCYKGRFTKLFAEVLHHALSIKSSSYEDTLRLDKELHEERAGLPPSLQMRPLRSLFFEQAHMILNRLHTNLPILKSICILHRTHIVQDRSDSKFAYSRKTCTEAALQILSYQAEIYFASQPGGRFFDDNSILTSLTLHDFLLAAMIICLDLYEAHRRSPAMTPEDFESEGRKHDALRLSHEIWLSRRDLSRDARHASNVLAAMLSKVTSPTMHANGTRELSGSTGKPMDGEDQAMSSPDRVRIPAWNVIAPDFPVEEPSLHSATHLDFDATSPLDAIFNQSDNIDWGFVYQHILDPKHISDTSVDWQPSTP